VSGHYLVRQGEVADVRVVKVLDPGAVETHVVCGPPGAEGLAAGGQFADEIGQRLVVRIASGLGSQQRDRVAGQALPIDVELARARVQEHEPGDVRRPGLVGEYRREEGRAEPVGGEDVQSPVPYVRR